MIDINTALQNLLDAIYGEEVRDSMHDGLYAVNQNSLEALARAKVSIDASITTVASSSTGYVTGNIVLNPTTWDVWECAGVNTWTLQGNIQGGDGEPGEDGAPGNLWYKGTGITGSSTTPTAFSGSGVTYAYINDSYLNSSTSYIYTCTTAGAPADALWIWVMALGGGGGGDMYKATYDVNDNGVVDDSEKLGGELPSYYQQATSTLITETTLADGDFIPFHDVSVPADRKTPWSNVKAFLKTYFDGLYATIAGNDTFTGAKAFAKGAIFYGEYVSLPTDIGNYLAMYRSATYGLRIVGHNGTTYQPFTIGALVSAGVFSMQYLANGDVLVNGRMRLQVSATDPTGSLLAGMAYYNTATSALRYYNGSAWIQVPKGLVVSTTDYNAVSALTGMGVDAYVMKQITDAIKGADITGTLTTGATEITLSSSLFTTADTVKYDYFTTIFGVSPTAVSIVTGTSMTLTFPAQTSNMGVRVQIRSV